MAMGIVDNKSFEKELDNTKARSSSRTTTVPIVPSSSGLPSSELPSQVIDLPTAGRKEGDVNVPNSLRQVIGATAFEDGREEALELGRQFGISPASVSAYSRGATSTSTYDDRPNQSVISKSRIRVQKRAMSRLMGALREITPAKLKDTKARDLASIAKDMSAVVKTLEPDVEPDKDAGKQMPQFVVFAPQFRDERSYEVIVAKE